MKLQLKHQVGGWFYVKFNYLTKYRLAGLPRGGGGATGAFCPGPHSAYGPQKDQYTLIEQSNNLLKQSLHIFALGPSSSLGCPVD